MQGVSSSVQGIVFSNILVSEVSPSIMIDQYYCDKCKCQNESSTVVVSGIDYVNIQGTYKVKPVHFACSDNVPCTGVSLATINVEAAQKNQ